jgi:peptidoglycan/LPS O-acetylase OafA/YrhL
MILGWFKSVAPWRPALGGRAGGIAGKSGHHFLLTATSGPSWPANMREPRGGGPPGYRADIDGLRAIAVTAVVLFHAGVFPFASGYVGVDIFFVISGYLIGGIILRDVRARRFSFAMFYARRARRIVPALLAVVLSTCVAGWFVLSPFQLRSVGATATSALLGISNISYYKFENYFAPDARLYPLLMTWSLGVEEQFYLLFPFLVFGIGRWAPRKTMVAIGLVIVASFLASIWSTYEYPSAAFYLLPFRAWELGVGVFLAFFELIRGVSGGSSLPAPNMFRQAIGFGGLAFVAYGICGFKESTPFPGFVALLPVLGTAAMIAAGSSWVNRVLLSFRPLVFVGTVSYSWYLWHWPLMSYVRNIAFDEPPRLVMILTAAVAFGLAVLSWRFVEQPFRRGPVRVRPVLLGYAAALTLAQVFPLAIKLGQGFPTHVTTGARQVDEARGAGMGDGCLVDWEDDKPNASSECVVQRDGRPTVVLLGDSHASALGDGLRAVADKQDWGYEIQTKPMCRPLMGVTNWHRAHPRQPETCAAFMQAAFGRIVSDPKVDTVILAGFWPLSDASVLADVEHYQPVEPYSGPTDATSLFHHGLGQAVALLVAAGKHVVIMGDVPTWRLDVSQAALTKANPLRAAIAPWLWSHAPRDLPDRPAVELVYQPNADNIEFFRSLAQQPMVSYVDLFQRFCSDGACTYQRDNAPLFIDNAHLSTFGARYALQDLHLW